MSARKSQKPQQKEMNFLSAPVKGSLKLVWVPLVMLIIAGGWVGLSRSLHDLLERFPVEKIVVMGEVKYINPDQLRDNLTPYMSENFFTVDLKQLKKTTEALSWIDYADARKEWPGTLIVLVKERVPVAYWGNEHLLSSNGEIFLAKNVQPEQDLPRFIGRPEQVALIAERFYKMQSILKDINLSISELRLADRVSWEAKLNNGLKLIIDEKNSLAKLERFTRLYHQFTEDQKRQLSSVDLRYENGLAIKWKADHVNRNAA